MLGDEDYVMEEMMDIPPDRAAAAKETLGIADDYFAEAHPAFSPPERERLAAFHRTLLAEASP